jgi:hypothetical protein
MGSSQFCARRLGHHEFIAELWRVTKIASAAALQVLLEPALQLMAWEVGVGSRRFAGF